ncbi:MAG: DNA mismatch endonuclease Vsr [Geminicoccaceae bacterium]|nr:DNA mismatch endonuclease Vsr [Geminicoccaceae bacterium]
MPADVVTPAVRSRMMAGIRGKNTKPELAIRSALHGMGFRYRLHRKDLPGRPDIVFPRFRAVILVHGCFWHGHGCDLFRWPSIRADFWRSKISRNIERDRTQHAALIAAGWRVGTVWECAMKGSTRLPFQEVVQRCALWLRSDVQIEEIKGNAARASR